jgi:DNA-binding IclR family transcriptional regulator
VPLHCSAIGKLFLAFSPASRRRRLLQHLDLRRYTEQTIVDLASLEAELRQIRKQQVSYDREEFLDGVVCIAVPVLGRNGELLAGAAIQAPQARMGIEDGRAHLPALRAASDELAEIFQAVD